MMSEVLKACPFCGTAPERLKNLDFSDSAAFWHPEADCILSGCSIHRDKWQGWNTRTPAVATDEGVERLLEALKPFSDCADQIADDEDDEEWAKFRLLIKDYRRAKAAYLNERSDFKRCPTCGGEFDKGEWEASRECPECETPIARAAISAMAHQP
jgi:predicted RNA-binding Zn-ribbon protein involved in translation (DUF1610 family)